MSHQHICTRWSASDLNPLSFAPRSPGGNRSGIAHPLETPQADALAIALSRVLYHSPQFIYAMPDEYERLCLLPEFFRTAIQASQQNGETYTTPQVDGGAVWIGPVSKSPLGRIMQMSLRPCEALGIHLDEVHQRLVRGPHWYLLTLGVESSTKTDRVRGMLIEPLLAQADLDDLPCYLETFEEIDLPFYARHGFKIAAGGKIPRGGPDFWAMIRTPK